MRIAECGLRTVDPNRNRKGTARHPNHDRRERPANAGCPVLRTARGGEWMFARHISSPAIRPPPFSNENDGAPALTVAPVHATSALRPRLSRLGLLPR